MARPSNAEKAAKEAAKVVEQVEEISVEQIDEVKTEGVQLVRMVLHPDFPGKARTANVHPLEIDNYRVGGWIVEE